MTQDNKPENMLLTQAVFEIKSLRRQNELMKARLDMFDAVNCMLHTRAVSNSVGMSPDVVHVIEKFISTNQNN